MTTLPKGCWFVGIQYHGYDGPQEYSQLHENTLVLGALPNGHPGRTHGHEETEQPLKLDSSAFDMIDKQSQAVRSGF